MARIVYSGLIDKISGSIGGTTFQSNAYGFTVKRKPNMIKPNTTRQNINKALFNRAVKAWREAAQVTRDNWNTWASTNPQYAKNNPTSQLSGFACFVKWNFYSLQRGGTIKTNPNITVPDIDTVSWELENNSGVLTLTGTWTIEQESWYASVFLSRILLPSQNFIGTKPKFVVTTTSATQSHNVTSAYTAIYGAVPAVGKLVGITYVMYMEDGGAVLSPQQEILTVVAP